MSWGRAFVIAETSHKGWWLKLSICSASGPSGWLYRASWPLRSALQLPQSAVWSTLLSNPDYRLRPPSGNDIKPASRLTMRKSRRVWRKAGTVTCGCPLTGSAAAFPRTEFLVRERTIRWSNRIAVAITTLFTPPAAPSPRPLHPHPPKPIAHTTPWLHAQRRWSPWLALPWLPEIHTSTTRAVATTASTRSRRTATMATACSTRKTTTAAATIRVTGRVTPPLTPMKRPMTLHITCPPPRHITTARRRVNPL